MVGGFSFSVRAAIPFFPRSLGMIVDFPFLFRPAWSVYFFVVLAGFGFSGGFSRARASQSVELTWNPSPDPNVVEYNVYYGTQSRHYTASITFSDVSDVVIPALENGRTYYFAVSAIDDSENESDLSNEASYSVPVPPALTLQAQASAVDSFTAELSWTPSTESDVFGYAVYYGTQSGVYTNSAAFYFTTDVTLPQLADGATYYFVVAAIDSYGPENVLSDEVSYTVPSLPPLVLQARQFSPTSSDVALTWNAIPKSDIYGYVVSYGTQHGVYTNSAYFYGTTGGNVSGLTPGRTYYFSVSPLDSYGVENILSNEVTYTVPVPAPIVLQTQIYTFGDDQPYAMEINTYSAVKGSWELDYSTDLQNWSPFAYGYGNGNADGTDIDVFAGVDLTQPQVFFRAINY
jgi:fibronectin type 3 domain-containing protein